MFGNGIINFYETKLFVESKKDFEVLKDVVEKAFDASSLRIKVRWHPSVTDVEERKEILRSKEFGLLSEALLKT
jgi:hypothetical protein